MSGRPDAGAADKAAMAAAGPDSCCPITLGKRKGDGRSYRRLGKDLSCRILLGRFGPRCRRRTLHCAIGVCDAEQEELLCGRQVLLRILVVTLMVRLALVMQMTGAAVAGRKRRLCRPAIRTCILYGDRQDDRENKEMCLHWSYCRPREVNTQAG
jgi:hypothetical protein